MAKVSFFKTLMPQILAVVVNPSQYKSNFVESVRYWRGPLALAQWGLIEIHGSDAGQWLERQLTQKIADLPAAGLAVARLDRTAHMIYFGILLPNTDGFKLLMPASLEAAFRNDVEKFVIMEDVTLSGSMTQNLVFYCGPGEGIQINFFGEEGYLKIEQQEQQAQLENEFYALCGIPRLGVDITGNELINETYLHDLAVNYDKGCFLGQETASKIRSRRGANYGMVVLQGAGSVPAQGELYFEDSKVGKIVDVFQNADGFWIANASLKREWRVDQANFEFKNHNDLINATVSKYPYLKDQSNHAKAKTLYLRGVKDFEQNQEERALEKLERAIDFDQNYADAYEAIGVIFARRGEHQYAIDWMDRLLAVNPQSVMAHTNKSLAYMKMGKIDKAEQEKSEATVKSFAMFGNEAKSKKAMAMEKEKEKADLARREGMFKQVLEIDGADLVALFGLADISFKRELYADALSLVKRALAVSPKHSQSILLKGKSLEKLDYKAEAIEVYRAGIRSASSQGELMPANEMQARLNKLI